MAPLRTKEKRSLQRYRPSSSFNAYHSAAADDSDERSPADACWAGGLGGRPSAETTTSGRRDRPKAARFLDCFSLGRDEKPIGNGAFSEVRRCFHRQTGRAFAVKILRIARQPTTTAKTTTTGVSPAAGPSSGLVQESSTRAEAMTELEVCAALEGCPGVVQLHQSFEDICPSTGEGLVYAVFEIMRGGNLSQAVVDRGSLPEDDARSVMKSLFSTCVSMRRRGITHRDIKLDNILLEHESVFDKGVKLADMGLAKKNAIGTNKSSSGCDGGGPVMHELCGTPRYMAPEMLQIEAVNAGGGVTVVRSKGYGPEVDIWSCGVCLWHMLCGFPPFEGDNFRELMDNILAARTSFGDPAWQLLTPEAKDLVQRCLTKDPGNRISAEQALNHPWMVGV